MLWFYLSYVLIHVVRRYATDEIRIHQLFFTCLFTLYYFRTWSNISYHRQEDMTFFKAAWQLT